MFVGFFFLYHNSYIIYCFLPWLIFIVWFISMDINMNKHIPIVFKRWNCHSLNCGPNKIVSAIDYQFSPAQSLSHVWLFRAPWTTAYQDSLSISNYWSLLLLPSIFPSIRVFSNESFASDSQSIGVSASASVLPMNIQDWFPLWWTGWECISKKDHNKKAILVFKAFTFLYDREIINKINV